MTDKTVAPDTDNLGDFKELFHGKANEAPPVEQDVVEDTPEDEVEETEDTEDDTLAPVDEAEDEPEPEEVSDKPKKKTAQERINDMRAKLGETERAAAAEKAAYELRQRDLEAKLAETLAKLEKPKSEPEAKAPVSAESPDPNATNEDGTDKYPLGEFDPQYLKDVVRFTLDQETEARRAEEASRIEQQKAEESVTALQTNWETKLQDVEKEIPDLRTKSVDLVNEFSSLEPEYAEYLATTLMQMDSGPQVMYYLSQHLDEAKQIVSKGPVGATIALGRLEAQFSAKTEKPKPVVSSAPEPIETRTRGAGGKFDTAPDTDDLKAFKQIFYKR